MLMLALYSSKSEAQALQQATSVEQLDDRLKKIIDELSHGNSNISKMIATEFVAVQAHVTAEVSKAKADTDAHHNSGQGDTRESVDTTR